MAAGALLAMFVQSTPAGAGPFTATRARYATFGTLLGAVTATGTARVYLGIRPAEVCRS